MNTFVKSAAFAVAILGLAAAQTASATTYKWTWDGSGPVNNDGGQFNAVSSSYNSATQDFTFEATMGKAPGTNNKPNGFWMAMSDGPNPKGTAGELAIFFFDASGSTPVLTAYGYNGVNGPSSYYDGSGAAGTQTPDRIATSKVNASSWINNLQVLNNADGSRTFKMDIKGSVINGYTPINGDPTDWKGVSFTDKFGIWFHPLLNMQTSYYSTGTKKGFLSGLNYSGQGWMDLSNQQAVPEPATMAVLAAGVAALARKRKKA